MSLHMIPGAWGSQSYGWPRAGVVDGSESPDLSVRKWTLFLSGRAVNVLNCWTVSPASHLRWGQKITLAGLELLFICVCVCVCVCGRGGGHVHLWRSEDDLRESFLSFYHVGSGDWTEVYEYLYPFFTVLESQYLFQVESPWFGNEKYHTFQSLNVFSPSMMPQVGSSTFSQRQCDQNVWPLKVLHTDTFSLCAQDTCETWNLGSIPRHLRSLKPKEIRDPKSRTVDLKC